MNVLVTRDRDSSASIAARLEQLGHASFFAPMLRIHAVEETRAPPVGCQALLVTSANAIRHLPKALQIRDLRVLAVGDATADAAREAGFRQVKSAGGDAADLERLAVQTLDPAAGDLLYARGRDVRKELAQSLGREGFRVAERVVYRAEPVSEMPPEIIGKINSGKIDAVLLMSRRAAENFARLLAPSLKNGLARVRILALAPPIARPVVELGLKPVECADHPDIESLLAMLAAPAA